MRAASFSVVVASARALTYSGLQQLQGGASVLDWQKVVNRLFLILDVLRPGWKVERRSLVISFRLAYEFPPRLQGAC